MWGHRDTIRRRAFLPWSWSRANWILGGGFLLSASVGRGVDFVATHCFWPGPYIPLGSKTLTTSCGTSRIAFVDQVTVIKGGVV